MIKTLTVISILFAGSAYAQVSVGPVPTTNGTLTNPTINGPTINGATLSGNTTLTGPLTLAGERRPGVDISASTYTTLATDQVICVHSTANAVTITLLASPPSGITQEIKDCDGTSAIHPITIRPSSGQIMNYDNVVMTQPGMSLVFEYLPSSGWRL